MMEQVAIYFCWFYNNQQQCQGLAENQGNLLRKAFPESIIRPDFFCHEVLTMCQGPSPFQFVDVYEEVARILKDKPEEVEGDDFVDRLYRGFNWNGYRGPNEKKLIKMLHVTDTHLDLDYQEGSNVMCEMVLCCHKS
mmetsp:Transcript_14418/g.24590  ORF Transcript_14418/g.24590 Transcript_14418/m.24590 type:complete len:137 (-) Transcript_14418:1409-1819(-)